MSARTTTTTTANTAGIAGKVHNESAVGVRSLVTASSGIFEQRALAMADGSFQFTNLPKGSYLLCAQPLLMMVGPKEDPYLDSCVWPDLPAVPIRFGSRSSAHRRRTYR